MELFHLNIFFHNYYVLIDSIVSLVFLSRTQWQTPVFKGVAIILHNLDVNFSSHNLGQL